MEVNKKIQEMKEEIIKETQNLIRIKSVLEESKPSMPFGEGVHNALLSTLKLGERLGFRVKNIDGYMGYIEWGEGEEIVGILGHLDVVPEGNGWKCDPFGGEIYEEKIFGRGALDDKGPVIAAIYGLYALKQSGFLPKKRIRILLGTNEESGCKDVPYYLEREEKPTIGFTPDAYFPIVYAEKGGLSFHIVKTFKHATTPVLFIKGGQRINMVPDYCEIGLTGIDKEMIMRKLDAFAARNNYAMTYEVKNGILIIKSKGISAHGSTPRYGKNAIMQALIFLQDGGIFNEEISPLIQFLAEKIGMESDGETLGIGEKDEISGELTLNVGTIQMNENVFSMGVNIRYPVTTEGEALLNKINMAIQDLGVELQGIIHKAPLYFEKEHKLIQALSKVYEEQTGEEAKLLAIGGGTYAKQMENIVAFGPIFPGKPDLDHQANECIEVEDLIKMTQIYGNAMKELAEM